MHPPAVLIVRHQPLRVADDALVLPLLEALVERDAKVGRLALCIACFELPGVFLFSFVGGTGRFAASDEMKDSVVEAVEGVTTKQEVEEDEAKKREQVETEHAENEAASMLVEDVLALESEDEGAQGDATGATCVSFASREQPAK